MKKIIWILVLTSILFYIGFSSAYKHFKTQQLFKENTEITIDKGENLYDLAKKLGIYGLMFKLYVKNDLDPNFVLDAGKYKINAGSDISGLLLSLKSPLYDEINIKILEGWNIYDIDLCLSSPKEMLNESNVICMYQFDENGEKQILDYGLIQSGDFIAYVQNIENIEGLSFDYPFITGLTTLEGFLYPDTYKISNINFESEKLVRKQLRAFQDKVVDEIGTRYVPEKWEEIVNLASIVEKEEKNLLEKPTVAGILKKRLNEGWMIGADITVCYPHELTSQECKLVISKYIAEKSEYNTRTMIGLPKTPIGNPSYETIFSTINSKSSLYYYYLHDSSGKIHYGETSSDHEYNKNTYLR